MRDYPLNVSVDDVKIVLAFGNYMNSSKRGLAPGFRLQSLDLVSANTAEYCRVLRITTEY